MTYKKICGIYMIKNKVNGKVYIGQSVSITKRWWEHRNRLNNKSNKNKRENDHLQKSWNKYGENNFEFTIIEQCDQELLNEREIYWIKEFNSFNSEYGYNKTNGGNQNKKVSEETRKLLSEINLEIHRGEKSERAKYSENQIRHVKMLLYCHMCFTDINEITQIPIEYISKIKNLNKWKYTLEEVNDYIKSLNIHYTPAIPVIMYDMQMNKIREFNSAKEASCVTGFNHGNINHCCNFKTLSSNNFIWLKNDENLKRSMELKIKQLNKNKSRQYTLHRIDDYGKIIETFNSIAEACKKYNLDSSAVSKVCNGKIRSTKGFKFKKEYIS